MNLEPSHLLKLRFAVARFGEMDGAGWCNSKGILGSTGKSAISRGFPKTHLFAQTRIACAVATSRCNSIFAPPGCLTLWNLPAEVEDEIAAARLIWCRNPDSWVPFFYRLAGGNSGNLVQHLGGLDLIDQATKTAVAPLKRSAEGKFVSIPFGSDSGRAKSLSEYSGLQEARVRSRSSTQERTSDPRPPNL